MSISMNFPKPRSEEEIGATCENCCKEDVCKYIQAIIDITQEEGLPFDIKNCQAWHAI